MGWLIYVLQAPSNAKLCDDANPCTSDSCDPVNGCEHAAKAGTCSDGDPCTDGDICSSSACKPGNAKVCDDGNPCTSDTCLQGVGCQSKINSGASCDDAQACTDQDTCNATGVCVGKAKVCDDGNACTTDKCVAGACATTAAADGSACDDNNACTPATTCAAGLCTVPASQLEGLLVYHKGLDFKDHARIAAPLKLTGATASDALLLAAASEEDNGIHTAGALRLMLATAPASLGMGAPVTLWTEDKCSMPAPARALAVEWLDAAAGTIGTVALGRPVGTVAGAGCAGKAQPDKAWAWNVSIAIAGVAGASNTAATVTAMAPFSTAEAKAIHTFAPLAMAAGQLVAGGKADVGVISVVKGDLDGKGGDTVGLRFTLVYDDNGAWKTKHIALPASAGSIGDLSQEAALRALDLDGDGDIDLLLSADTRRTNRIAHGALALRNDGGGTFVVVPIKSSENVWVHVADVGKDGKVDLLLATVIGEGVLKLGLRPQAGGADWYTKAGKEQILSFDAYGLHGLQDVDGDGSLDLWIMAAPTNNDNGSIEQVFKGVWTNDQPAVGASLLGIAAGPLEMGVALLPNTTLLAARHGQLLAYQVTNGTPNDGNPCTIDSCDKAKGCTADKSAVSSSKVICEDGDLCTTMDGCSSGSCKGASATDCDDGSACTGDSCDKAKGCLNTAINNGKACTDNDGCVVGGQCNSGVCDGGQSKDCDDGKPCTNDACDAGTCKYDAQQSTGAGCDDSKPCTEQDTCAADGSCKGTLLAKDSPCSDNNNCIQDRTCDAQGVCAGGTSAPKDAPCQDNNPCTADACDGAGKCLSKAVADGLSCDDGVPCTVETCKAGACASVPGADGGKCDDNNPCTGSDACLSAQCVGKPLQDGASCAVGFPCFASPVCSNGGCMTVTAKPDGTTCDDGQFCSADESCQGGTCQSGQKMKDCNDANECTQDACENDAGKCVQTPMQGAPCNGGSGTCDASGACK